MPEKSKSSSGLAEDKLSSTSIEDEVSAFNCLKRASRKILKLLLAIGLCSSVVVSNIVVGVAVPSSLATAVIFATVTPANSLGSAVVTSNDVTVTSSLST